MDLDPDLRRLTDGNSEELIRIRRTIHQNPELAFEEVETARLVSATLTRLGIPHRNGVGKTGIVGLIESGKPGPTLGIRADMDCLPMAERTGLPFASRVAGKMHACGHDLHTAILLGVATVLGGLKGRFRGRVKLIFQPAEEVLRGARAMIDDGVLEEPRMDAILGYHNWPILEAGKIGFHPTVVMASCDHFDITLKGVSGHGAHPHRAVDAITNAAYFVTQLQTVVSREVAPLAPAVVSVGEFHAGTARNVLPDRVVIKGTARALDKAARAQVEAALRRLLEGVKTGLRLDYELAYEQIVPVLANDRAVLGRVLESARAVLGADKVDELPEASMGSEDFAWFSEAVPAAHLRIGSKAPGRSDMLHNSDFQPDERAIPTGVLAVSRAAIDLLA